MEFFKRPAPDGSGQSAALSHHPLLSVAPRAEHCGNFSNRNKRRTIWRKAMSRTCCLFADIRAASLRSSERNPRTSLSFLVLNASSGEPASGKEIQRDVLTHSFGGSWLLCFECAAVTSIQKCLHLNWPWTRADQTANLKQVITSISNPPRILNHFLCQFQVSQGLDTLISVNCKQPLTHL